MQAEQKAQARPRDEWVSVAELARRVGRPERTVRRWVACVSETRPDAVLTLRDLFRRTVYRVNYGALRDQIGAMGD